MLEREGCICFLAAPTRIRQHSESSALNKLILMSRDANLEDKYATVQNTSYLKSALTARLRKRLCKLE